MPERPITERPITERIAGIPEGFRMRGGEVSRIEAFSDGVFAFALALLVIRLDPPREFRELREVVRGLPAFVLCFGSFFVIWFSHHAFFRRYGLRDSLTLILNTSLLLVVLFYVYPLKFLFNVLVRIFSGNIGSLETDLHMQSSDMSFLMALYGLGFVTVFLVFMLLNLHAWRHRAALQLTELERLCTRESIQGHAINAGVGLLSLALLVIEPVQQVKWSGFAYFLIPLLQMVNGWVMGRRRGRLEWRPA